MPAARQGIALRVEGGGDRANERPAAGRHLDMGAMALNEAVGLHLVEAR